MMESKNQDRKDIILILDESGSMESLGDEPKQAVNIFLKEQKEVDAKNSTLTFYKFNNKVTKLHKDKLLSEFEIFDDYTPSGMTALFDAIGHAITDKEKLNNVTCMIITDGFDNMSKDFDNIKIKNLICDMEIKHKWNFIFLGANQDLFKESNNIGISNFYSFDSDNNFLPIVREISQDLSSQRSL